jgi:hypothetical protein
VSGWEEMELIIASRDIGYDIRLTAAPLPHQRPHALPYGIMSSARRTSFPRPTLRDNTRIATGTATLPSFVGFQAKFLVGVDGDGL